MSASTFELVRWSASSGSGVRSRAAIVLASPEHQWEAAGEGEGPVSALLGAINSALAEVLGGPPRLLTYDVYGVGVGLDKKANVSLTLAPPTGRGEEQYQGQGQDHDILAATARAYLAALNDLAAAATWLQDISATGRQRHMFKRGERASFEETQAHRASGDWFDR